MGAQERVRMCKRPRLGLAGCGGERGARAQHGARAVPQAAQPLLVLLAGLLLLLRGSAESRQYLSACSPARSPLFAS